MLTLFCTALLLGLAFSAAPGPVFAETIRCGVRGGFRPALAVQLGSVVGDATWAVIGLATVALALRLDVLRWPVGLAGAAYLLWLSWDSWRAARVEYRLEPDAPAARPRRAFRAGVLLSLTNPQNLPYWAAVGSALGALGIVQPDASQYAVYFAGFVTASVLWSFLCAALVDRLFRRVGAAWARFTYRLCAAALLALALTTLRDLLQPGAHPGAAPAPASAATPQAITSTPSR